MKISHTNPDKIRHWLATSFGYLYRKLQSSSLSPFPHFFIWIQNKTLHDNLPNSFCEWPLRPSSDTDLFMPSQAGYLNSQRLGRPFRLAQPEISAWERLWFKRRTFHEPKRSASELGLKCDSLREVPYRMWDGGFVRDQNASLHKPSWFGWPRPGTRSCKVTPPKSN